MDQPVREDSRVTSKERRGGEGGSPAFTWGESSRQGPWAGSVPAWLEEKARGPGQSEGGRAVGGSGPPGFSPQFNPALI